MQVPMKSLLWHQVREVHNNAGNTVNTSDSLAARVHPQTDWTFGLQEILANRAMV